MDVIDKYATCTAAVKLLDVVIMLYTSFKTWHIKLISKLIKLLLNLTYVARVVHQALPDFVEVEGCGDDD